MWTGQRLPALRDLDIVVFLVLLEDVQVGLILFFQSHSNFPDLEGSWAKNLPDPFNSICREAEIIDVVEGDGFERSFFHCVLDHASSAGPESGQGNA